MDQQPSENKESQGESQSKVETDLQEEKGIPFWTVVISVLQASFGVQNSKNRERDFSKGKFLPFVVAALGFTLLFVITLIVVVRVVLSGT